MNAPRGTRNDCSPTIRRLPCATVVLLCALFVGGCFTPNRRVWLQANIKAHGPYPGKGDAVYGGIRIGTDESPYDGRHPFVIRLPSGTLLPSDDFSEPTIRPIALALLKTGDSTISHDLPTDSRSCYSLEGVVTFTYENHQLVSIAIYGGRFQGKSDSPEIAKRVTDTFHAFPIPEKYLTEIFGPPDQTINCFTW